MSQPHGCRACVVARVTVWSLVAAFSAVRRLLVIGAGNFLFPSNTMSSGSSDDTLVVEPPAGAASGSGGGKERGLVEFSPEQWALIDRLIATHVATMTTIPYDSAGGPPTSSAAGTGEF